MKLLHAFPLFLVPLLAAPEAMAIQGLAGQTAWFEFQGVGAYDEFGVRVAGAGDVNGDGINDFIVGAHHANGGAGAAYVYSGATGNLLLQFDGTNSSDNLGTSVSGVGDVDGDGFDDVAVGADSGSGDLGSVTVYSGSTGLSIWDFHGLELDDVFGASVAGAGDVDGDGVPDVMVGSPKANPLGMSNAGSAYVYSGATGLLLWRFDGPSSDDWFGEAVAGPGDLDGDGVADLLIGAHRADPGGLPDAGSAYVYSGASGVLLWQFDGVASGDNLGASVAGAGDVDGDGVVDLIVGAPLAYSGNRGAAYVYSGATSALIWQFEGLNSGDKLGNAVSDSGDVDGDGVGDLIVGVCGANPNGRMNAGSTYLYSGATGAFLFKYDGEAPGDGLGRWVAGAGDVDGDGLDDVIVGAYQADPGGSSNAGVAYVFTEAPDGGPGPYSWQRNPGNGNWYALLESTDWLSATTVADLYLDVELATVRDLSEQTWLFQNLMNGSGIAYIGLTDEASEGSFLWRSGETTPWWSNSGYFGVGGVPGYWYFLEPNNLNDEDYATIGRPGGSGVNGEWNDADGVTLHGAILEWAGPVVARPVLSYSGPCPGTGQASCTGLTPGARTALAYGGPGMTLVPTGPCGPVVVELLNPSLLFITTADLNGELNFSVTLPAGACGNTLAQAMDLDACVLSNVLAL